MLSNGSIRAWIQESFKRGSREIPERKQRTDDDSWMYDEDKIDDIRQLARTQSD
ncbi:hypothetical protein MMC29_006895, partial [Sticta canariensis]|nr:hypothetical protein [Sticta canariensis]